MRVSRRSACGARLLLLVDLFDPRLRLFGLGGLVAEALDEFLHPLELGLLAVDRLAEGDLAGRLLLAPGVPGAGEEAGALGLHLQHRGADRLQEPAVVGDQDDGGVEVDQVALQPLQRGDVEMVGGLVEQQQVGLGGQRPGQRGAGQLAAGEGRELALAPARGRSRGRAGLPAPGRASGSRRRLRAGAGRPRRRPSSPRRRPATSPPRGARARPRCRACRRGRRRRSRRASSLESRGGRWSCRATRAPRWIVSEPESGRQLAGEDPQQGRLAGAVAAGEGHPFARLELEGDVLEQQLAADVDVQGGCGRDRHGVTNLENRRSRVTSAHGEARCDTSASWRGRGRRGAPPSAPTARRWASWRRGRWRCRPGSRSSGSGSPATG